MKSIKERFLGITLIITFGLAFLGYLFIRGALRHFDNYVSYFMLTLGTGLIFLFCAVLLIFIRYSQKKAVREELEKFDKLRSWNKYKVDLDTIQIKSNNWSSSHFIENTIYDIEIKEENVQTILEFEVEVNGIKKQFHWPSDLQPKSLEMYFAMQKETDLYLDPNDQSSFYLDLSFIPG